MDVVSSSIFLVIGIAIGYFVSRLKGKPEANNKAIETELEQSRHELKQYRQQVEEHFASSAQLLEDMAKQYQSFYEHMAGQSKVMIKDESNQPQLFADYQQKLALDEEELEESNVQPKDYSNQPSGLFTEKAHQAS